MREQMNTQRVVVERKIPGRNRGSRFAEVEHADNAAATLKRVWTYFAKEKSIVIAMLAIVIFGALCGVYAPSVQSRAIDIIAGAAVGDLFRTLALMLCVYLIYSLCQLFQGILSARLSQRIVKRMRSELFGKVIDLPVKYLDSHSHGDVMSRMTNDIENISNTVSQSLPSLFSGALTVTGTAAVMLLFCWQLALLSFVTVLLTFLATKILSKRVRKYSRQRQNLLGEMNGTVEEMIDSYRSVVAYNHQSATSKSFSETSDLLTKAGVRTEIFSGVMGPIMNCIGNIGFVIIAAFGCLFSIKGIISVGVISAFIIYARQFSRPINEIAQLYGQLQTAVAGAERVFVVLDEEVEDLSGEPLGELESATVTFNNVNFSYTEGKPVLRGFSLTVPGGKKVALVGATGSGKTTVVNLLMRFYDLSSGEILINGRNIAGVSRKSLRQKAAIVLQDTVLFSDTIENNLKYGNPDADDKLLESALEMSRSAGMIRRMKDGIKTRLSGSGSNVSQGQRQLLAIARAFVSDPKILILDEATSNVDTRTEKAIQDAMHTVMKNRTSIIIAHRLSTIRDADIIVVMDGGRIVESGTHERLLSQKGKYYDLYMTQFAGFAT